MQSDLVSYRVDHILAFKIENRSESHYSLIIGLWEFHVKYEVFQEFMDNMIKNLKQIDWTDANPNILLLSSYCCLHHEDHSKFVCQLQNTVCRILLQMGQLVEEGPIEQQEVPLHGEQKGLSMKFSKISNHQVIQNHLQFQ